MNDFSRNDPVPPASPARPETVGTLWSAANPRNSTGPGNPAGSAACQNEGCRKSAAPGEKLCEACDLERSLYRRDERWQDAVGRVARVESALR